MTAEASDAPKALPHAVAGERARLHAFAEGGQLMAYAAVVDRIADADDQAADQAGILLYRQTDAAAGFAFERLLQPGLFLRRQRKGRAGVRHQNAEQLVAQG